MRVECRRRSEGFTLIEILIALFVMTIGIVGVLALFPVGIDASREAMDNLMVAIIGESAIDQMQIYMNVSEIFDSRVVEDEQGKRNRPVYSRYYTAEPANGNEGVVTFVQDDTGRPPKLTDAPVNFMGFYLGVRSGKGAGIVRQITGVGAGGRGFRINPSLPGDSGTVVLDNSSKFVVTRYGFPTTPQPMRIARISGVGSSRVQVESVLRGQKLDWGTGVWTSGATQYYALFNSGQAKGRVYRVVGGGQSSLSLDTGSRSLQQDDRVVEGDTVMVLGNSDIIPSTYPPNFGRTNYDRTWETPPIIYYHTSLRQVDDPPNQVKSALYGWACIISAGDRTRVTTVQREYPPICARLDVLVFKRYAMSSENSWYPLPEQPAAIGYVTAYISPL